MKVDDLLKQFETYFLKPVQNGMGAPALDYHGTHRGFAFVIETKAPGKSPTPRQINTIRKAHAAGTSCFMIDGDLTELHNWLTFPIPGYLSVSLRNECEASFLTSILINENR